MDKESQEMLQAFVTEAFDALDTNEHLVENLGEENNSEYVNAIFRVFHTLKGLSGFFNMKVINKVTHEAEFLLDLIRKENKVQSEDIISIIYSTFDFLRELLSQVALEYTDESGKEGSEDMIIIIRDAINKVQNQPDDDSPTSSEEDIDALLNNLREAEDNRTNAFSKFESDSFEDDSMQTEQSNEIFNDFEPEETFLLDNNEQDDFIPYKTDEIMSDDLLNQFLNGSVDIIEEIQNNFVKLEKRPDDSDLIAKTFGLVHSIKGNAGFMGFKEIEEVAFDIETILDSLRSKELEIDETIISIMLSNAEIIANRLAEMQKNEEASAKIIEDETPFNEDLYAKTEESAPKIILEQTKPTEVQPKAETPKQQPPVADKKQQILAAQKKDIRVETGKIDKLFDLVGELITIESMVTNNPDLKGLDLPSFNKSANMLNKITRELQEITMSVRMMPLEGLFNKMKRLVRDVSLKMNKKIEFSISGQDTEMDKNVIDEIADPLVHILRNAIDHGVETPQKRLESGKNEVGNVSLSARYEGNEILVIVEDDGKGIPRDIILKKAIERGLVQGTGEKLSDKEVFQLIFEPGFSTADTVTDISGRGVGMDVVRKNIEQLRGNIDIESELGKGSRFTFRIPLTLAILESMVIRIGKSKYALPILAVSESLKVSKKNITETMDGLEMIKIRNEVLPVYRLHEIFNIEPESTNLDDGIIMVIESRSKKVCLFADEIIGQQQAVIKSLTDYIGKVAGIMGCMILGDGGIGLIIDIESLIAVCENRQVIAS